MLRAAVGVALALTQCSTAMRCAPVRMESDMQWRRRMSEKKQGWESTPVKKPREVRRLEAPADFDGTRQNVAKARAYAAYRADPAYQRVEAEVALEDQTKKFAQEWVRGGGKSSKPPANAMAELSRALDKATTAGVQSDSAAIQRATALLAALESATGGTTEEPMAAPVEQAKATTAQLSEELAPSQTDLGAEVDSLDAKLDAIFAGGYGDPSL